MTSPSKLRKVEQFRKSIETQTTSFLALPYANGLRKWLTAPKGQIYVRRSRRYFPGSEDAVDTFDLASLDLEESIQGQGWFKSYLAFLAMHPATPNMFVLESVMSPKLLQHATEHWHPLPNSPYTFYLSKAQVLQYLASYSVPEISTPVPTR
jgi:hypothetical protein